MVATGSCLCLHNTRPRPANHSWNWATMCGGSSLWAAYCDMWKHRISVNFSRPYIANRHWRQSASFRVFHNSTQIIHLLPVHAKYFNSYFYTFIYITNQYILSFLTSPRSQAVRKPNSTASLASRSNQGTPMSQSSHSSLFQRSRDQAVNATSIRIT